jgi:hypothetical protein
MATIATAKRYDLVCHGKPTPALIPRGILKDALIFVEYWVAWTSAVYPCLFV